MDDLDPALVARLGDLCLSLPDAGEENAWHGVRWRVRGRTFAHVLRLRAGKPASYAEAAGVREADVLTFRVTEDDAELFGRLGHPYWAVRWGRNVGGLILGERPDWAEISELITDSYCLMAPRKLVERLDFGPGGISGRISR